MVNVSQVYSSAESSWTIDVWISTDKPAAFVWLDTKTDIKGRFSDNAFLLSESAKIVSFWSAQELNNPMDFFNQLQVTHLAQIIR